MLPPHIAVVLELARKAQDERMPVRAMVRAAEKQFLTGCIGYTSKFVAPPVIERGLVEKKPFLVSFTYHVTPAGEVERARIRRDLERAGEIPRLLETDPAQAATLALELGDVVLCSVAFKKHAKALASAMRTPDGAGGVDGATYDNGLSNGSFDSGCFDAGAFGALDGCIGAFDGGFSDGGGGDGASGGHS